MADKNDDYFESAQPYGGDVGGDSVSRDEVVFLNLKRTYDVYQDLDIERARANNAAHALIVQAAAQSVAGLFQVVTSAAQNAVSHAKDQDQVAVRVAHNGATADKFADEQAVADSRARSAATWGTGVTPPQTASSGQAADDIGEGDD